MARLAEAVVLILIAVAGVALLRSQFPPAPPAQLAVPASAPEPEPTPTRRQPTAAAVAKHLNASTAAHGSHTLQREDGRPSLEGKSSFAGLGNSHDDRVARVRGAQQRRHARTLAQPKTAKALEMMTSWVEPRMTEGQARDWWGSEEANH